MFCKSTFDAKRDVYLHDVIQRRADSAPGRQSGLPASAYAGECVPEAGVWLRMAQRCNSAAARTAQAAQAARAPVSLCETLWRECAGADRRRPVWIRSAQDAKLALSLRCPVLVTLPCFQSAAASTADGAAGDAFWEDERPELANCARVQCRPLCALLVGYSDASHAFVLRLPQSASLLSLPYADWRRVEEAFTILCDARLVRAADLLRFQRARAKPSREERKDGAGRGRWWWRALWRALASSSSSCGE